MGFAFANPCLSKHSKEVDIYKNNSQKLLFENVNNVKIYKKLANTLNLIILFFVNEMYNMTKIKKKLF